MSGTALIAAVVLLVAPGAALARDHTSARPSRTHSGGMASSPRPASHHSKNDIHSSSQALGSGDTKSSPSPNADAAVQAENELLDRKLKSICRGC
jgi:hypothetical protein